MLAQSFLTAAELGITDRGLSALIKLLGMLDRGEISHEPQPKESDVWPRPPPQTFNLGLWRYGTAACLGGWAEYIGNFTFQLRGEGGGLDDLFYLDTYASDSKKMLAVTPEQAAIALRNYLTTGEPRWWEVIES